MSPSLSPAVMLFYQYALSLLFLLPRVAARWRCPTAAAPHGLLVMGSIFGLASQLLLFVALSTIPLVEAVLLANSSPLFIPLVVLAWEHTPIGGAFWASLPIGFAGVVLRPPAKTRGRSAGQSRWRTVPAPAPSSAWSPSVAWKRPSPRGGYVLLSAVFVSPALMLRWATPAAHGGWLILVGVGVTMALARILTIRAYAAAPPEQLAPFNDAVVVFSALIGWAISHEVPNWLTGIGIVRTCSVWKG
ncbi:MAG: DMT family transporter [Chloroflexi bacterium]|nr:DMT family transporter [Chloroflexota bacterium]